MIIKQFLLILSAITLITKKLSGVVLTCKKTSPLLSQVKKILNNLKKNVSNMAFQTGQDRAIWQAF